MVRSYKHLTHNDRYSIERLIKSIYSYTKLAKRIGFNKYCIIKSN